MQYPEVNKLHTNIVTDESCLEELKDSLYEDMFKGTIVDLQAALANNFFLTVEEKEDVTTFTLAHDLLQF